MCPCDNGELSVDHMLFNYELLQNQRQIIKKVVIKTDN
jgi:hypothetical protein